MTTSSKKTSASGFTLVELLITLVIIAVLTVIGTAVSRSAISRARSVECVGNLRAIGTGLMAFAADHNGHLPYSAMLPWRPPHPYRRITYWFDALNPYMGHPEYAADRDEDFPEAAAVVEGLPLKWQQCPAKKVNPTQRQTVGYGWNAVHFGWDSSRTGTGLNRKLAQVPEPGRTIIVGDSKDAEIRIENQFEHRYIYDYRVEKSIPFPKRHAKGGNYLFVDGHVENLSADYMRTTEGLRLMRHDK